MHRYGPTLRLARVLAVIIGGALLSGLLATLVRVPPAEPSMPPALGTSALHGVWRVVDMPERGGPGPFSQPWFALRPTATNAARLIWAGDGFCSQLDAILIGREMHIVSRDTSMIVAFHADATATATVEQGNHRWTLHYVKQADTLPACDWLLR